MAVYNVIYLDDVEFSADVLQFLLFIVIVVSYEFKKVIPSGSSSLLISKTLHILFIILEDT